MLSLDPIQTRHHLDWDALIAALSAMFKGDCVMPVRHHHTVGVPGEADATLLLMPAWQPGQYIGVKLVSVFPDNHLRSLPAIHGSYLLSSGRTGELLAVLDGGELTARRTAAASALAARHLAREDASTLLVVGFPLGFQDTLHRMPVARHAGLASSFGLRFHGLGYFLTDGRTHRGISGAPVVKRASGNGELPWHLLGIHSTRLLGNRDEDQDEALGLNCTWYADILMTLTE